MGAAGFVKNAHLRTQKNFSLKYVQVMGEVEAPFQQISRDLDGEGWDWWNNC